MPCKLILQSSKYNSRREYILAIIVNMQGNFSVADVLKIIKENDDLKIFLNQYEEQRIADIDIISKVIIDFIEEMILEKIKQKNSIDVYFRKTNVF